MSSATVHSATVQSAVDRSDISGTTSESDHPLSSPERAPELGDTPNTPIIRQWNGDPMDWESWPTGRPGPFASESRMEDVMKSFQRFDGERDEQSRTEEKVVHVAEFSSSGQGEFDIDRSSSE